MSAIELAASVAIQMQSWIEATGGDDTEFPQPLIYNPERTIAPHDLIGLVEPAAQWEYCRHPEYADVGYMRHTVILLRAQRNRYGHIAGWLPLGTYPTLFHARTAAELLCDAILNWYTGDRDSAGHPRSVTFAYRTEAYAP